MDSHSFFDRLTRLVATARSRRALGATTLGALAGLLGLRETDAAPCPPSKKRCKGKCIRKRQCCKNANCRPGATGRICKGGRCVCSPARPKKCGGVCIPSAQCCGAECTPPLCTGVVCPQVDHATTVCQNNVCVIAACDPGFRNCDGDVSTGCETPIDTPQNCGACGHVCPGGAGEASCVNGKCRLVRTYMGTATPGFPVQTQSFIAPANGKVTALAIGARGGAGGPASQFGPTGGEGGRPGLVEAWFNVRANEPIRIRVGGVGVTGDPGTAGGGGGAGGGNGAAAGFDSNAGGGGGGGGGSTDLRRDPFQIENRIMLAAGGGGGGGGGGSGQGGAGGTGGDGNPPAPGGPGGASDSTGQRGANGNGAASSANGANQPRIEVGVFHAPARVEITFDES